MNAQVAYDGVDVQIENTKKKYFVGFFLKQSIVLVQGLRILFSINPIVSLLKISSDDPYLKLLDFS